MFGSNRVCEKLDQVVLLLREISNKMDAEMDFAKERGRDNDRNHISWLEYQLDFYKIKLKVGDDRIDGLEQAKAALSQFAENFSISEDSEDSAS